MKAIDLRKETLTFSQISNRAIFLESQIARKYLFAHMPAALKEKFIDCYLRGDTESLKAQEVMSYLYINSEISKIIKDKPSSAMAFEYLYAEKKPVCSIDKYFLKSYAGNHVLKRIESLERNIPEWIKKFYNGQRVVIDNMGSGPGHDMIRVLKNNRELADKVFVRNIDIDKNALEIGRKLVAGLGLSKSFSFINDNFVKVASLKADIILLIGILCPLDMETSVKILRIVNHFAKPGGIIIYSTNQIVMAQKDPLTDFIMRLGGWKMDYKTDNESWLVGQLAGWHPTEQFFDDSLHFQCMTAAKKI